MLTYSFMGYGVAIPLWYLVVAAIPCVWALGYQAGKGLMDALLGISK